MFYFSCDNNDGERKHTYLSPVPATSLAACMKVNSVYSPLFIPSIEAKVSLAALNVTMSNSISYLGKGK